MYVCFPSARHHIPECYAVKRWYWLQGFVIAFSNVDKSEILSTRERSQCMSD